MRVYQFRHPDISILFNFLTLPEPLHSRQGSIITLPLPRQSGQTLSFAIIPNGVLCCVLILPEPLHFLHFTGLVPGFAPLPLQAEQLS